MFATFIDGQGKKWAILEVFGFDTDFFGDGLECYATCGDGREDWWFVNLDQITIIR